MIHAILFLALFGNDSVMTKEDSICVERGHLLGSGGYVTAMLFSPRTVNLPDRTIEIYWDRNWRTGKCLRCGKSISKPVQEKPDTVIIWQKGTGK